MTKVQFPLAPPSFLVKLGGFKAFKKESQMKKIKELINFSGYDIADELSLQFYNVEFKKDFGVFRSSRVYNCIEFNFHDFEIKSYDEDGEITESEPFQISAIA